MLKIPLIYIKDKQAFASPDLLRLIGKPIDIAKELQDEGYKLIHIVDLDAKKGLSTNMDVYDKLTYFVNIQVECAPKEALIRKLLSVKARVVIDQAESNKLDFSAFEEKKLLVMKANSKSAVTTDFHDVIIDSQNPAILLEHFEKQGKRIIVYGSEEVNKRKLKCWGQIIAFPS